MPLAAHLAARYAAMLHGCTNKHALLGNTQAYIASPQLQPYRRIKQSKRLRRVARATTDEYKQDTLSKQYAEEPQPSISGWPDATGTSTSTQPDRPLLDDTDMERSPRPRRKPLPSKRLPRNPTPEQVIEYFESLEAYANAEQTNKSRVRRNSVLPTGLIAFVQPATIDALYAFSLEDALELLQLIAELEYAVDSMLFPDLVGALEDHIMQHVDGMEEDAATWVQVFWLYRLSLSLRRSKSPLLRHTLYMLLHHLDTISVDGLCSVVLSQAYVDTQRVNNAFASKVLQRAVDIVPTQHTYTWQLSNMIWSIARVNHPLAGEHVPKYLQALQGKVHLLKPKFAANVVWACATLRIPCVDYCNELTDAMTLHVHEYPPKQLANLLWGWARLEFKPPGALLNAMTEQILRRARNFAPQDWDSLLWGYTRIADEVPPEILDQCADTLVRLKRVIRGRTLCSVIKSFASCLNRPTYSFEQLVGLAEFRANTLSSFDISNLLLGLGHMGYAGTPKGALFSGPSDTAEPLGGLETTGGSFGAGPAGDTAARNGDTTARNGGAGTPAAPGDSATGGYGVPVVGANGSEPSPGTSSAATIASSSTADTATQGSSTQVGTQYQGGARGGGSSGTSRRRGGVSGVGRAETTTPLMLRLEARTLEVIDQTSHQGLANIMWGFTKLHYYSPRLMHALRAAVQARVDELNCRDLLDVLWSLARQPEPPTQQEVVLLTTKLSRFFTRGFQWGPREYSNLLWSLGTLGTTSDQLLHALRPQHVQLLPQCNPMDLANALWGLARLGSVLPQDASQQASIRLEHLVDECTPDELGTCMVSLARLGDTPPNSLLDKAVEVMHDNIDQYDAKAMAYMVSSLAKFEYKDDTIVNAVLNSLETHPGRFDILDWENLLMASARLGTCPRRILAAVDALLDRMEAAQQPPPTGVLALCMWLTALHEMFDQQQSTPNTPLPKDTQPPPTTAGDAASTTSTTSSSTTTLPPPQVAPAASTYTFYLARLPDALTAEYAPNSLRLLHQCHMLACGQGLAQSSDLPVVLRTKIAAEVGNKAPDAPPSRMQVEVATTLSRLSIPHQSNVPVKNNLFQVDVVLQRPKQQVCILLLQPSDVIRGTYELLGSTMYRKKLLEAYGWKVLTLGFWEWQRAPSDDRDAQEAFLMTYLRKHGLLQ